MARRGALVLAVLGVPMIGAAPMPTFTPDFVRGLVQHARMHAIHRNLVEAQRLTHSEYLHFQQQLRTLSRYEAPGSAAEHEPSWPPLWASPDWAYEEWSVTPPARIRVFDCDEHGVIGERVVDLRAKIFPISVEDVISQLSTPEGE